MSNVQKKVQKNIKKLKNQEKKEYPLKNQIIYFTKILCAIIILAIVVCVITYISTNNYSMNDQDPTIDYSQIVAGQAFTRSEEEYYVVFYLENDVLEKSTGVSNAKIYNVNLNSGMNKNILSESSNKESSDSTNLMVKETTIMKIVNGKNVDFIEGHDNVIAYIESL